MPYDTYQAERIHRIFEEKNLNFEARKMMGGMVFMLDDKMCVGTHIDKRSDVSLLMVRIGVEAYELHKDRPGCQPMDFTGRPMKGYAFITAEGYDLDEDLQHWVDLAIAFNPFAKASRKKKKKVN